MTRPGHRPLLAALLAAASWAAAPAATARQAPLTLDTHVDIPFAYLREARFDPGLDTPLQVDLGKMQRGGLDAAFFVVWVPQGPLTPAGYAKAVAQAKQKYDAIDRMLAKYPARIRLATTPAQVEANHAAGRLSAMIGIENAYSLGHDLQNLDAAYAHGARYVGLVHVGHDDLCTSSMPQADLGDPPVSDAGLSDFGRAVVRRANDLGMMVDISHASDACVRDVLALSRAPIIASHSSARALVNHPRDLPDELLRAIAAKGGVIQAVAYKGFLKLDPGRELAEKALETQVAKQHGHKAFDDETDGYSPEMKQGLAAIEQRYPLPTLDDFVAHIRHMVEVAGIDHVGIASDFDGGGGITGWMDAGETANVTAALRRHGFGEAEIAKLWSGNLLRVWGEVERDGRR